MRDSAAPQAAEPLDRAARQRLVAEIPQWHHSINVGDGVVTPGGKTPAHHHDDLVRLHLPAVALANKSVLDIGAWDGYYTFMAEGAAASRVVALDHYAWSVDYQKAAAYATRQCANGEPIRAFHTVPELWDPVGLPGKCGFDLARRLLNSRAEVVVDDFMTMDLAALGTFDVVLLLGVIYHLEEPLRALRRLRQVTHGFAAIETEAVLLPGRPGRPLWQFVDAAQLNNDPSIWWVPTAEGLRSMCLAAGFARAEVVAGPPKRSRFRSGRSMNYRAVVHAFC
jgi:tRNA (mo5U34)-methyltransferase